MFDIVTKGEVSKVLFEAGASTRIYTFWCLGSFIWGHCSFIKIAPLLLGIKTHLGVYGDGAYVSETIERPVKYGVRVEKGESKWSSSKD